MNSTSVASTKPSEIVDGFSPYPESAATHSQFGIKLKFLKTAQWVDGNGVEVDLRLIVMDVLRRVQEWPGGGSAPLSTITIAPGEQWPDIDAMNAACRERWYEQFGKMAGPFQGEHVVLLVDPVTMASFWWPSPCTTIGASTAVRELRDSTCRMRSFRGEHVFPLVRLRSSTFHSKKFGDVPRPVLKIETFVAVDAAGRIVATHPLEGITLKEEMSDAVPY